MSANFDDVLLIISLTNSSRSNNLRYTLDAGMDLTKGCGELELERWYFQDRECGPQSLHNLRGRNRNDTGILAELFQDDCHSHFS